MNHSINFLIRKKKLALGLTSEERLREIRNFEKKQKELYSSFTKYRGLDK